MSSCLIPQTFAERPPFRGGPPIRTTYDGGFSGDREPDYELSLESSARLLQAVAKIPEDSPEHTWPLMLRLLQQRYKWLEEELWAIRSISATSLPPVLGFELDSYLETSDSLEGRLVRTLDALNDAMLKVKVKLDMQKCPFPLSEL